MFKLLNKRWALLAVCCVVTLRSIACGNYHVSRADMKLRLVDNSSWHLLAFGRNTATIDPHSANAEPEHIDQYTKTGLRRLQGSEYVADERALVFSSRIGSLQKYLKDELELQLTGISPPWKPKFEKYVMVPEGRDCRERGSGSTSLLVIQKMARAITKQLPTEKEEVILWEHRTFDRCQCVVNRGIMTVDCGNSPPRQRDAGVRNSPPEKSHVSSMPPRRGNQSSIGANQQSSRRMQSGGGSNMRGGSDMHGSASASALSTLANLSVPSPTKSSAAMRSGGGSQNSSTIGTDEDDYGPPSEIVSGLDSPGSLKKAADVDFDNVGVMMMKSDGTYGMDTSDDKFVPPKGRIRHDPTRSVYEVTPLDYSKPQTDKNNVSSNRGEDTSSFRNGSSTVEGFNGGSGGGGGSGGDGGGSAYGDSAVGGSAVDYTNRPASLVGVHFHETRDHSNHGGSMGAGSSGSSYSSSSGQNRGGHGSSYSRSGEYSRSSTGGGSSSASKSQNSSYASSSGRESGSGESGSGESSSRESGSNESTSMWGSSASDKSSSASF